MLKKNLYVFFFILAWDDRIDIVVICLSCISTCKLRKTQIFRCSVENIYMKIMINIDGVIFEENSPDISYNNNK